MICGFNTIGKWIFTLLFAMTTLGTMAQKIVINCIVPDKKRLQANAERLRQKDQSLQLVYALLLKEAEKALLYKPVSVVNKKEVPPSGDRHDYMSLAPYYWPDPDKKDGVPYIRKDGLVNPEVKKYMDKVWLNEMKDAVYVLGLAYHYTKNEKYAAHAAQLVRTWFIDTATKMNPHLNFGQAVKGENEGRAAGLIDTRHFIFVIEAVKLIQQSPGWSKKDDDALKTWFASFDSWLTRSRIGIAERKASNNHGLWYDAQRMAIASYLGNKTEVGRIVDETLSRMDTQVDDKGFLPKELDRTNSFHYSLFSLEALTATAQIAEDNGIDLWNRESLHKKSFRMSFLTHEPYLLGKKEWIQKDLKPLADKDKIPVLFTASHKFSCLSCMDEIRKISAPQFENLLLQLL